jgi:hypothetical protein
MAVLAISPSSTFVAPGGQRNFSASGGTGPYVFSISSNRSGGSINPTTGLYTAGPMGLRPDVVTVTDSVASTASAIVTVKAGLYGRFQQNRGLPWQKLPNGQIIEADYGAEKDWAAERARQSLLVGFPGMGPPDALDLIAAERVLPRATSESPADAGGTNDQALAARLAACWTDDHGWFPASSHASMLYALDRAGFPMGDPAGAHIIQRYKRYSWLTASGGTPVYGTHAAPWTADGADPRVWSQFVILFGADVTGLVSGSYLAGILNGIVDIWRPRKARFMGTIVVVSGDLWGWPFSLTWGAGGLTWGSSVVRFIPPV